MLSLLSKVNKNVLSLLASRIPQLVPQMYQKSQFSGLALAATKERLLQASVPLVNQNCGLKVKVALRRRCKDCYFVWREERLYVMCKTHPRHKQMSQKKKEYNTWTLTHASQSKVRPW